MKKHRITTTSNVTIANVIETAKILLFHTVHFAKSMERGNANGAHL